MIPQRRRWALIGVGLLLVIAGGSIALYSYMRTAIARRRRYSTRRSSSAVTRRRFRLPTRTTSGTWTAACRSHPRRSRAGTRGWSGRPATIVCGTGSASPPSAHSISSRPFPRTRTLKSQPRQPLGVPGSGQRAVLRRAHRSRSETARAVARSALTGLSAGSLRERSEIPGCRDRRARQDHRARLVLRVRHGCRRAAAVSQSRLRRARGKELGPEALLYRPAYYNSKTLVRPYRVGMSCGFCHVGPNPINPPADPEHPKWENLSSNVGAQYFWVDRIFDWDARSEHVRVPAVSHVAPRLARHLAHLDRQHQQSADDERGLSPRPAAAAGEAMGSVRRWLAAGSTTSSSTTTRRTARSPSSSRSPARSGRRACSRTAPTRWARSAR